MKSQVRLGNKKNSGVMCSMILIIRWVLIRPFKKTIFFILIFLAKNPKTLLYSQLDLVVMFQGRTALWDAALLLCYRIKTAHGGVVQGINLGSSALNLLSVFEMPEGDDSEC